MSAEIIATLVLFGMVLVVFGALAVLVVTQTRATRREIAELCGEIRAAATRENPKPSIKASDDPKSIAE